MIEKGEKPAGQGNDDDGGDDGEREHLLPVPEPEALRLLDPTVQKPDDD